MMSTSTPSDQTQKQSKPDMSAIFEGSEVVPFLSFEDMGLSEDLLRGVYSSGFEEPSPIQQRGIVPISKGLDVIVQAQSGTGKTGTFTIGCLNHVDTTLRQTQILILSPTRELTTQTKEVTEALGARMKGLTCMQCIGGTRVAEDQAMARRHPHVVVGCPGRVLDLIERGALDLRDLRTFVLDEADEMLSRGFEEQIENIIAALPPDSQSVVVSATFPPETLDMTRQFMRNPIRILVPQKALNLSGIHQYFVDLGDEHKLGALLDITSALAIEKMIIFVNSCAAADRLTQELNEHDFTVSCVHSQIPPTERPKVISRFKRGDARVLVATDIIARGFDVQQVSLVINYEVTRDPEDYVHRIGRCGRRGRKGVVINFLGPRDIPNLEAVKERYGYNVEELPANFAELSSK